MHLPSLFPLLSRRSWLALPALCALILAASPAAMATRVIGPHAPLVELSVIDRDSGASLPQYRHRGQAWLPGEPGRRYALRLRNLGPQRLLAVVSVDGVNVVDGRTADPRQAGYVLGPWQTVEIDGWRKSLDAVAGFVFVDPAASYAARTGRPANIGTIGIAVFREQARMPRPSPPARIARAAEAEASTMMDPHPAPAPRGYGANGPQQATSARADSAAPAADLQHAPEGRSVAKSSLGTGHGELERAPAYHTAFQREASPAQLTELRYDTHAALAARGIRMGAPPIRYDDRPRAFPGSGFVPDPW